MRTLSQHLMLVEMIVIFLPVSLITMVFAPFVVMISFSTPFQISNILLGITYCLSCTALIAAWVLALCFWRHGAESLLPASRSYAVLATFGTFITVISCVMALFGNKTGFLFGIPLLIPYMHLLYERHTSNAS